MSSNNSFEVATAEQLSTALATPGVVVVDLRSETERYHRVAGAVHAEWDRVAKTMPTAGLPEDKETLLILHCASGNRVKMAAPFLEALGYKKLVNGGGPGAYPPADGGAPPPPLELWSVYGPRRLIFQQSFDELGSSTYTYLFGCPTTGEALLVDPVLEHVDRDIAAIQAAGLTLKLALNTHCHADHITGTGELKKRLPGLKSDVR